MWVSMHVCICMNMYVCMRCSIRTRQTCIPILVQKWMCIYDLYIWSLYMYPYGIHVNMYISTYLSFIYIYTYINIRRRWYKGRLNHACMHTYRHVVLVYSWVYTWYVKKDVPHSLFQTIGGTTRTDSLQSETTTAHRPHQFVRIFHTKVYMSIFESFFASVCACCIHVNNVRRHLRTDACSVKKRKHGTPKRLTFNDGKAQIILIHIGILIVHLLNFIWDVWRRGTSRCGIPWHVRRLQRAREKYLCILLLGWHSVGVGPV